MRCLGVILVLGMGLTISPAFAQLGNSDREHLIRLGLGDFLAGSRVADLTLSRDISLPAGEPFHSTTLEEFSPVQMTGGNLPAGVTVPKLNNPCPRTRWVAFAGVSGKPASHEGADFVHHDPQQPHVLIMSAAPGTVAYVRTGCPQSSLFQRNTQLREAGAGWGNHVVLYHGNGVYTRYAHLIPGSIKVKPGDSVGGGVVIGEMGNSGRSELRHLHFEIGWKKTRFVTEKPAQSFDLVFDPKRFLPLNS